MRRRAKNSFATGGLLYSSGRGGLISHRSHTSLVSMIRENLGEDNLQKMLSSCFTHLFYIDSLKFQGQLYNILLRSLDKHSLARNRLSFNICGQNIEFTPTDFGLITGLGFSGWYDPPIESEIHRSVFGNTQKITLGEIINAFKKECNASRGKSALSLRLAYLVMLYGVLLVVGNTNNSIDKSYIHLIDDVDMFNAFPWGSVAYKCLVQRSHRARENLENIILNKKKIAFDANGFVIALQVWAYEVVPIISRNCAAKIEVVDHLLPRMRKWAARNHFKFDFINKLLLKCQPDSLELMKPSTDEVKWLRSLGVEECDATMSSLISAEEPPLSSSIKSVSKKNEAMMGVSSVKMQNVKSNVEMEFFAKRIANLKECMTTVSKMSGEIVKAGNIIKQDDNQKNITREKVVSKTGLRSSNVEMASENGTSPQPCKRPHSHSVENSITEQAIKSQDGNLSKDKFVESVVSNNYDPNEPSFKCTWMIPFEDWCRRAKNNAEWRGLVLPFYKHYPINVHWFSKLYERHGWLDTVHIECMLNIITLKTIREPDSVLSYCTFMDLACWGALSSEDEIRVREVAGPFLCGIRPRHGRLNWSRARRVFGIGHINDNHWISFVVCLDECRIIVYDSQSIAWGNLQLTFDLVARNLEKMCQELRIWELRGHSVEQHFDVVLYENTPQQVNNADCGVLTIKFFECFANGANVGGVDANRCGIFRRSFAKQIFDRAIPDSSTIYMDYDSE